MNKWWDGDPREYFWLEVTARPDLGADLNAPQTDEDGKSEWSYSLVAEAADGDVVFHFHKPRESIVSYSFVRGSPWSDEVIWGARGASARNRNVHPYPRPGFRRALQGYKELEIPVTLAEIRQKEQAVLQVAASVRTAHPGPIYFPFVPYPGQGLRTVQGYMTKMPAALAEALGLPMPPPRPEDAKAPDTLAAPPAAPPGARYRRADEDVAVSTADPMPRDPALVERGLRDHRRTQNALADLIAASMIEPLSPGPADPDWDLAWLRDDVLYVAEVKSINAQNEERQLRLGLGQVLRYRQRANGRAERVVGVLVASRRPRDDTWNTLCVSLGVILAWPGYWRELLDF